MRPQAASLDAAQRAGSKDPAYVGLFESVRILFSMRHLGSFRMYESVLRRLVDAGHEVHVVASHRESLGDRGVPDALLPDVPGIRWSWDEVRPNAWLELATAVRIWTDY